MNLFDILRGFALRFKKRTKQRCAIILVLFKDKKAEITTLFPDSFDVDKHLATHPPYDYGFPKDKEFKAHKALYILSLLTSIPSDNGDLIEEDGYVPINARQLQRKFGDYKNYIDYLKNSNVIVCNGKFIIGEKSFKYRWHNRFNAERWEEHSFNSENISVPVRIFEDKENIPSLSIPIHCTQYNEVE